MSVESPTTRVADFLGIRKMSTRRLDDYTIQFVIDRVGIVAIVHNAITRLIIDSSEIGLF